MLLSYSTPIVFNEGEVTAEGNIAPSVLLHKFQNIARIHAEKLGWGFRTLLDRDLIWVMTSLRYELRGRCVPGEEYELVTYPRKNTSMMYQRDFYVRSGGRDIAAATSMWCIVTFSTRKLTQTELPYDGEFYDRDAFPERPRRIRAKGLEPAAEHVIELRDLDGNRHTNNCRYVELGLEALGSPEASGLTVSFAKETRLGERLILSVSDDRRLCRGTLPDGTEVFAMQVEG